jgi:Tfp pilus assembly protein PilF
MSLLMDALKKAEAAKRQAAQGEHGPAAETAPAQAAEPGNALPELPHELSLLDDQFASGTAPAPARAAPGAEASLRETQRDREAAHNLFTVKRSPSRAPFWIGLAGSTLAAVAGIGYWFWWQLQPPPGALQAGPALAQTTAAAPPAPAPAVASRIAPEPAPATTPPPAAAIVAQAPVGSTSSRVALKPAVRTFSLPPHAAEAAESPAQRRGDPTRTGSFAARSAPPAADTAGEPRLHRAVAPREQINPAVARGYAAYIAGDMAGAKRGYEEALRSDPRSLDALNGMTAVALRAGRRDLAETYLARALEVDPRDAYALPVLAALKGRSDPQTAESRLRAMISSAPDTPAAHFGLGNLYAREGRWAEAQQAYFRAFSSEPDNPDYLFNLAVSLDHLRQPKLSLQYYQSALGAARPGAFDRDQVAARIRELQQVQ